MAQVGFEIAIELADVAQIVVLAVAFGEPGENSENLGDALGGEDEKGVPKSLFVEIGFSGRAISAVVVEKIGRHLLGHENAGILQQRGEVVGGMTHDGVLRIYETDARGAVAAGQPQQIRGMVIPERPHRPVRRDGGPEAAPTP